MSADEAAWNVHLYAYDDLAMVREAVASIPDDVPVHVLDGRYWNFPGENDLTDGLEDYCGRVPNARYHAPPRSILPFGDPNAPSEYRSGVAEKAQWATYDVLPQSEWTLKMDADERLQSFDVDLGALDSRRRYCPTITRQAEGNCHIARLWQPRYWTMWIDDCPLPRELFPRDTSLERLARAHLDEQYRPIRMAYRSELRGEHGTIAIDNVGDERPSAYLERRVTHLRSIGRDDRADEVAEQYGLE